jgi:hypothetical protein
MKSILVVVLLLLSAQSFAETPTGERFKKVLIIVLENTDYSQALQQPYLKKLTQAGALLNNMNGVTHPSQGNYIAMIAGDTLQVKNDSPVNLSGRHIGDLLESQGYTWKAYVENFPGNCSVVPTNGRYVRKHNPFISFTNVSQNPQRCASIQDSVAFENDAKNGTLPNFAIYSPNILDDGHDTGPAYASNWLQKNFDSKFSDEKFMKDLLVVITFDEASGKGNHIYTLLLGDSVKPGSVSTQFLTHINLLKTIEVEFNLGDLGRLDRNAESIQGVWQ